MFAGFHNQSPLLTMVKFSKQRETINLQLIQRRSQSPKYKFCKGKLADCLLGIEMVQVSQENDKRSIFAEYYLSETVLYLSDNMVPDSETSLWWPRTALKKFEFWISFICNYFSFSF